MKITFITAEDPSNIHDVQFPSGIASLEACLTRASHEVKILWRVADWLTPEKVAARLKEISPEMVCISLCFSVLPEVERLVPVIREACPKALVVIGGSGVTYCPDLALRKTGSDFAIIGEGEKALTQLAKMGEEGSYAKVPDILGIAYLDGERRVRTTGMGELTPLEGVPLPSWDKYPMHWWMRQGAYFHQSIANGTDRTFYWLSGRGCPYSCNFCVSGCKPRYKGIAQLEAELDEIYERFHPTFFGWMDNLTIPTKARALELADMHLRKGWGWRYTATGHAAHIDKEMLRALKASGCASILYGVESANDHIQERIGKRQTVEQLECAIRLTKEAGIAVQLSAMFGQPGETWEDFERTIQMVLSVGDQEHPTRNNQGLSPLMTFPGTSLYRWAMDQGYFRDEDDFYDKFFNVPDRYQGFINYTDLPREAVVNAHVIARAANDWAYAKFAYEHQSDLLGRAGIMMEDRSSESPDTLPVRDNHYQSILEREGLILKEAVKILRPRCVLETGTNNGYATGWLAQGQEEGGVEYELHTCDARDLGDSWRANVPRAAQPKVRFYWKSSLTLLETHGPFDFAFLDGQHDAAVIEEELKLLRVGQDGGPIVFLHDVRDEAPPSPLRGIQRYQEWYEKNFGRRVEFIHLGGGTSLATNMNRDLLRQTLQGAGLSVAEDC